MLYAEVVNFPKSRTKKPKIQIQNNSGKWSKLKTTTDSSTMTPETKVNWTGKK